MDIRVGGDSVVIELPADEAARIGFAMRVGYEELSRAEYWIRTGIARADTKAVVDALYAVEAGQVSEGLRAATCWCRGRREPAQASASELTSLRHGGAGERLVDMVRECPTRSAILSTLASWTQVMGTRSIGRSAGTRTAGRPWCFMVAPVPERRRGGDSSSIPTVTASS